MRLAFGIATGALVLGAACVGDDPSANTALVGEHGGACFSDGKCKEGLVCTQATCLNPGETPGGKGGAVGYGAAIRLATGQAQPEALTTDGASVFWANAGSKNIAMVPKASPDALKIVASTPDKFGGPAGGDIKVDDEEVFWTAGSVWRAPKAGGPVRQGTPSDEAARLFDTFNTVYMSTNSNDYGGISFFDKQNDVAGATANKLPHIGPLVLDGDVFYFGGDPPSGTVASFDQLSKAMLPIARNQGTIRDLVMDSTSLYWVTDGGRVVKLDKTKLGQAPIDLLTGQGQLNRMAVDDGVLYFTSIDQGTVKSVPVTGGTPTILAQSQAQPWGIAVDKDGVYWTNAGDGTVWMAPRTR